MRAKHKAILFNFVAFALLFIVARLVLGNFLPIHRLFLALIAAIFASVFAPKFAATRGDDGKQKVLIKWIFTKGFKEV